MTSQYKQYMAQNKGETKGKVSILGTYTQFAV